MQQLAILYVEDDAMSRKVMKILLQARLGYQHVTIFEDSSDILARAEEIDPPPNIVLLDIHMKPFTGFEVLKMLRSSKRFEHSYIIALTASVMNEEILQLRTAGFDGCLGKPINSDTFADTLMQIMGGEDVWQILG
jgi:two-component system, cell cycle response regulator DivK